MDTQGKWRLAPAYDMTFAYNPQRKWTSRHQMLINGNRENSIDDDFFNLAKQRNKNVRRHVLMMFVRLLKNGKSLLKV